MKERNSFLLNVFVTAVVLALAIFCASVVFADEADDVIKIQSELIINLEKQVVKQKEINKDNEKIISGNKKIIEMQEKHLKLQHKDINRLIDEKAKGGDGVVDDVKKQAAIPMFIWILLSLL